MTQPCRNRVSSILLRTAAAPCIVFCDGLKSRYWPMTILLHVDLFESDGMISNMRILPKGKVLATNAAEAVQTVCTQTTRSCPARVMLRCHNFAPKLFAVLTLAVDLKHRSCRP